MTIEDGTDYVGGFVVARNLAMGIQVLEPKLHGQCFVGRRDRSGNHHVRLVGQQHLRRTSCMFALRRRVQRAQVRAQLEEGKCRKRGVRLRKRRRAARARARAGQGYPRYRDTASVRQRARDLWSVCDDVLKGLWPSSIGGASASKARNFGQALGRRGAGARGATRGGRARAPPLTWRARRDAFACMRRLAKSAIRPARTPCSISDSLLAATVASLCAHRARRVRRRCCAAGR